MRSGRSLLAISSPVPSSSGRICVPYLRPAFLATSGPLRPCRLSLIGTSGLQRCTASTFERKGDDAGSKSKQKTDGEEGGQLSKRARALLAWEREQWHKRQKEKEPSEELSKNKIFRMTPVDSKMLDYINRLKLGRRKDEPPPVTDGRRKEQLAKVRTETDKLWERKVTFLGGATARESFLPEDLPEIAFIGRSNVGKSSLINALTAQGKVRVSDTPGETQQINWYRVGKHLTLIDLPGYGFAFAAEEKVKAWTELMCEFLTSRKSLKRICVLIDARHGFKPADLDFIDMLEKAKRKYQIVMTKADLVTPPDLARRYHLVQQAMKRRRHGLERILMVSSWNATGLSAMRTELTNLMVGAREAPPATKPEHKPTSLLPDYEAYEPSEERPSRQQHHQNRSPSRERRSTQPTGYNRGAGSGGASRGRGGGRGGGGVKGPQERSARGGESASRYNRSSGSPTASRGTRGGRGRGGGGVRR